MKAIQATFMGRLNRVGVNASNALGCPLWAQGDAEFLGDVETVEFVVHHDDLSLQGFL